MKAILLHGMCNGRNVRGGFVKKKNLMSIGTCTITIRTTAETF